MKNKIFQMQYSGSDNAILVYLSKQKKTLKETGKNC